jgi:hypothetical protein|tara:strand:+ start:120 stop:494 length:375 start_codon:yes stop_codon:yes gene_type:complete
MADRRGISGKALARLDNTLGVPTFILNKDISGATTTTVVADAPFSFRIIDAWSIGTSADGGTWRVTDGTNIVISNVTQAAADKEVDRAADVDDLYYRISKGGDVKIVSGGASLSCTVYILCARV